MIDEKARQKAQAEDGVKMLGLVVLLARAGGSATFTQDEFEEVLERYGGPTNVVVHHEVSHVGDRQQVELTLVRKPARQGDLVS